VGKVTRPTLPQVYAREKLFKTLDRLRQQPVIHLLLLVVPLTMAVPTGAGDMALIPSGAFLMGSLAGIADERPVHRVHLDSFYPQ